jgi:2-polyprenyl-3-methyl-5-hydroxy-6-metoxy-1,4-benzoquinol methylase
VAIFNNLVSQDDIRLIVEKIRQGQAGRLLRRLAGLTSTDRIHKAWQHTQSPSRQWVDLEQVRRRLNKLATDDEETSIYEYVCREHLAGRSSLRAISIGCGTGTHELAFARSGQFERIDALDVSASRIQEATELATEQQLDDIVHFSVADALSFDPDLPGYDIVIAFNALHHMTPLGSAIQRLAGWLKPDGLLILRDFVGPSRFQWTETQVDEVQRLLTPLPPRFRTRWGSGSLKDRVLRPGRLVMKWSDPSEAAESDRILTTLADYFETVELRPLGGTVLHLLLKDIAHNFSPTDPETDRILATLFEAEDQLLHDGDLTSDFVFGVFLNSS